MTTTAELIDSLVERASPVRRLRPPLQRAGLWLGFAALVLALLALVHGLRPDLLLRMHDSGFVLSTVAALATAIFAAIAAFIVSVPGRPRPWLLLPLPALAVWIATIGYGCLTDWVVMEPDGLHFGEAMRCFATLVLTSVPLAIGLAVMLRYAALLRAGTVAAMGGLAVAALTSTALSLLHDHDATAMVLLWNLGTAAALTTLGSLFGKNLFAWFASRFPSIDAGARV